MEEILDKYKDMALDFSQPFALEVYHLHKQYPNDSDLGANVRKLILKMEKYQKDVALKNSKEQLEKIIQNGK